MKTIFAEYNPQRNSIDVYTSAGYMLRIDCWEAEKNLKTTPCSDWALNALAIDEPLEYARLYLDGTVQMWVDAEDSFYLWWLSCHSQYLREWQFLYLFEYNLVFELLYGKIKRANTIIFFRLLNKCYTPFQKLHHYGRFVYFLLLLKYLVHPSLSSLIPYSFNQRFLFQITA